MSQEIRHLERLALEGFRTGMGWQTFLRRHGAEIRAAEFLSIDRHRKLVGRLLHLLASGERSGQFPAGDPDPDNLPWLIDDAADAPHDTITTARWRQTSLFDLEPTR